ncbi:MAG: hypothetical protein OXI73_13705 [Rhodospirillales bacterium]|nr:hypothetical protein [Rhodospirillales bacterium]
MDDSAVRMICWNMAHRQDSWRRLLDMECDLALLQEACRPPDDLAEKVDIDPLPWPASERDSRVKWRSAIGVLSDRVAVEWLSAEPIGRAPYRHLAVSSPGTLTAARVRPRSGKPFIAVSMYAELESPLKGEGGWIFSDSSAHRLVSDLAVFVGRQHGHRIVAAGDLNLMRGYSADGSPYWAARYQTVFDRMEAMGLPCIGPQFPNGRQAEPWPEALPKDSLNVPTWHLPGRSPAGADRQLDYVFASRSMADSLSVRALNEPGEWGPSDHCCIAIEAS